MSQLIVGNLETNAISHLPALISASPEGITQLSRSLFHGGVEDVSEESLMSSLVVRVGVGLKQPDQPGTIVSEINRPSVADMQTKDVELKDILIYAC